MQQQSMQGLPALEHDMGGTLLGGTIQDSAACMLPGMASDVPSCKPKHDSAQTLLDASSTQSHVALWREQPSLPRPLSAGGVTVQMLGGDGIKLSADAQQLKDWVEKGEGVCVAMALLESVLTCGE